MNNIAAVAVTEANPPMIKCVVWDLDNTIWDGVLLEDTTVTLRPDVTPVIKELDRRGIINSIASRNDHDLALQTLATFGLKEYFLYPMITWHDKSTSLRAIAEALNIDLDTFAFIDDDPFEREEVTFLHPQVLCLDETDVVQLPEMPRMQPRFMTPESRLRRQMYQSDALRTQAETTFTGTKEAFLTTLHMQFTVKRAEEADLQRAEELTLRTHQLNTTGYTYTYQELDVFRKSPEHLLLVARLADRFGTYGTIGIALVEQTLTLWTLKLLLMSCRVMSRGVGTVFINCLMSQAQQVNAQMQIQYIPTGRNRTMYVTCRFLGFKELKKEGDLVTLGHDLSYTPPLPDYMQVQILGLDNVA